VLLVQPLEQQPEGKTGRGRGRLGVELWQCGQMAARVVVMATEDKVGA
jgi:hypothetical protein